jgi:uncharacterized protein
MALTRSWIMPLLAAVSVLGGLGGCEPRERERWEVDPPVAFDTARVVIESAAGQVVAQIAVELAATQEQRAYGLMERRDLPSEQGMLFTYPAPQEPQSGFWMYRTLIPLEIAFLDETGAIVAILEMDPCEAANPRLCPMYSPGVPYVAALEVNRGFFGRWGIGVGDRVRLVEDGTGS